MGTVVELVPFVLVPFLLVGVLALGGLLATRLRQRRRQQAFARLLQRDPSLEPTPTPLGLDHHDLVDRCGSLPRGDRRYGLEHAVQGPMPASVGGREEELEVAAFRWWWEQRRRGRQQAQHSHRYQRQHTTVALVRLPAAVPSPLRLRPESALGRLGMTRAGRQVESDEFNRRFRVESADDRLAVMLLDAGMQALLPEEFAGRSVELVDDLLVLAGEPAHRDASLPGVIGQLPAARQDARRLLGAVPDQVWRQLRLAGSAGPVPRTRSGPHARPAGGTGAGRDGEEHRDG